MVSKMAEARAKAKAKAKPIIPTTRRFSISGPLAGPQARKAATDWRKHPMAPKMARALGSWVEEVAVGNVRDRKRRCV